jgi:hypothetical protein
MSTVLKPYFLAAASDVLAVAQDLDHQIRADVAAADDGGLELLGHVNLLQTSRQPTLPNLPMCACTTSPALSATIGPSAPERIQSPLSMNSTP